MFLTTNKGLALGQSESLWHDLIRLFLLLQVVFGHMGAIALPNVPLLLNDPVSNWPAILFRLIWRFGSQSAFLFVFLSGYMVGGALFAEANEGRAPRASVFFLKRLKRIGPIAFLALLLTSILDVTARSLSASDSIYINSYAYDMVAAYSWENFWGNMFFLQPIVVNSFGSNGPLWTLGYIVQFYVLGWLLVFAYTYSKPIATLGLLLTVSAMLLVRFEWGILFIAWLTGGVARRLSIQERFALPFMLIGCLLFVFSNLAGNQAASILCIPFGLCIVLALEHLPLKLSAKKEAFVRNSAEASYTIYAFHHPVAMCVFALLFKGHVHTNLDLLTFIITSSLLVCGSSIAGARLIDSANKIRRLLER